MAIGFKERSGHSEINNYAIINLTTRKRKTFDIQTNAHYSENYQLEVILKNKYMAIMAQGEYERDGEHSRNLAIIELETGKTLHTLTTENLIHSLTLHPQGWLVCSEFGGVVECFDPDTFERIERMELNIKDDQSANFLYWNPWKFEDFRVIKSDYSAPFTSRFISQRMELVKKFLKDDPASIVRSYLFPKEQKRREMKEVESHEIRKESELRL
jgi:hypothetical protein